MKDRIRRAAEGLVSALKIAAGALLAASVAINFANIAGRYFFRVSIPWAEEVMLFLIIASVFLACGAVAWSGGQIRMDAFVSSLPRRPRRIVEAASDIALAATGLLMVYLASPVVSMLFEYDQRSSGADVPLFIPQSMLPIGFGLMAALVAARLSLACAGAGPVRPGGAEPPAATGRH